MKIRNGFVSNSSSSSFICDVCGGDESGWDLCMNDAEMFECVGGHTLHESCGVNFETPSEDDDDYDEDWRYGGVASKYCPLCSMIDVQDDTILQYVLVLHKLNKEELVKTIKGRFNHMNHFDNWVKKNSPD